MSNLLEETRNVLHMHGKLVKDIAHIGDGDELYMSWETFKKVADKDYNAGFGTQQVSCDLTIVFKDDTWLTRWEYDGSEGWEYHEVPKPTNKTRISQVFRTDYEADLKEINGC